MAATVRNLLVCSDGTWASPQSRDRGVYAPSNVVKLVKALRHGQVRDDQPPAPDQPAVAEQLVFYDKGVGTGNWLDRLVGGATGAGLEQNVLDGYQFLATHYQPGDRLFLVGFSRGAYTVRRLAGFVARYGLLPRPRFPNPVTAAEIAAPDPAWLAEIAALYREFQRATADTPLPPPPETAGRLNVGIEALGVWDTVGALGLPEHPILSLLLGLSGRDKHQFIDEKLSPKVRHGYHALALDEPRAAFKPSLWAYDEERVQQGTLQQVWFAGAHSNVGGSYQECGLADLTLRWMVNRLRTHRVLFRDDYLERALQPDPYGEVRNPRTGWGRLLYPHTWQRQPPPGTFLHPSVGDRGVPTSFYQYLPHPTGGTGQPAPYQLEHGLYTNAPPATDLRNAAA